MAAEVVEFLFRHEKGRFEVAAGQWLTQSEARGYLLAGQSGRGMLTSAQAAHDIGVKAAKQLAKTQEDAKRAGKAARKRAPEAARRATASLQLRLQVSCRGSGRGKITGHEQNGNRKGGGEGKERL